MKMTCGVTKKYIPSRSGWLSLLCPDSGYSVQCKRNLPNSNSPAYLGLLTIKNSDAAICGDELCSRAQFAQ
jgi:hypothetical protein